MTLIIVVFYSCTSGVSRKSQEEADTLPLSYSRLLHIVKHEGYHVAEIADPWKKGSVLHRYILVSNAEETRLPQGTVIRVPVDKAVVFTTVHASLLADMGMQRHICGMADVEYVKRKETASLIAANKIANVGSSMSPDVEKIISLSPDVILLSPFENSGGYGRLDHIGVPVIECADYMEISPLARAEWMKFYGMLFGAEHQADSIFNSVETRYAALAEEAKGLGSHPTVMVDFPSGGTWYVPGGESSIGRLIADAGGKYCFADDRHSGSVALSVEKVVSQCEDADLWLFRYGGKENTLADIADDYKFCSHIKAFANGNVYGCSTERTTFFESTPFHPERLLEDFISMIHPQTKYQPVYFKRVK
ncbi:MAG: ABC transporter substrate-binding protein [Prevotella sp.]